MRTSVHEHGCIPKYLLYAERLFSLVALDWSTLLPTRFGAASRVSQRPIYVCEICQTVLDEHHCKAICPNCGRMLDCSDLPGIQANAIREDDGEITPRKGWERDFIPREAPKAEPKPESEDSGGVANLP